MTGQTTFRTGEGGRIDRAKPINFTFDGVSYQGVRGDTLASALLANDVMVVGKSPILGRPRGIMTAESQRNRLAALRKACRRRNSCSSC